MTTNLGFAEPSTMMKVNGGRWMNLVTMFRAAGIVRFVVVCSLVCVGTTWGANVPVDIYLEGESYDAATDIAGSQRGEDINIKSGGWIEFEDVNFLEGGWDSIHVDYRNVNSEGMVTGGTIEVRLGSKTGTLLSRVTDLSRNGKNTSRSSSTISDITGTHSVFVLATDAAAGEIVCGLDRVKFTGTATIDPADAATYYVDAENGSDSNDGKTIQTPFKTIAKASSVMKPGSKCLIRGGVYHEMIRPAYTGYPGNGLTYEAYNGENVFVSAADPLTGWEKHEGNIYKTNIDWNMGKFRNQVFADGEMVYAAACPNYDDDDYWLIDEWSYPDFVGNPEDGESISPLLLRPTLWTDCPNNSGCKDAFDKTMDNNEPTFYTQLRDKEPQETPCVLNRPEDFFKGGLMQIFGFWYSVQGEIVASERTDAELMAIKGAQSKDDWPNVTVKRYWDDHPMLNGGYTLISHVYELLDHPNEHYIDVDKGEIYIWMPDGGSPEGHVVEAKRRLLVADLNSKSYVTLRNLKFLGGSMTMENARHCTVEKCDFKYITHDELAEDRYQMITMSWPKMINVTQGNRGIFVGGEDNTLKDCLFAYSSASGIIVDGNRNTIQNNVFHTINYVVSYDGAVFVYGTRDHGNPDGGAWGSDIKIINNTFRGVGRQAIFTNNLSDDLYDSPIRIAYNKFSAVGMRSAESASIYLADSPRNMEIDHNWFYDMSRAGIWTDFQGAPLSVHHNVFYRGNSIRKQERPNPIRGPISVHLTYDKDGVPDGNTVYNNTILTVNRGEPTGTFGTNYLFGTPEQLGLRDAANFDFRPTANSVAIDKGLKEITHTYKRKESGHANVPPSQLPTGCCDDHPALFYDNLVWSDQKSTGITITDFEGDAPDLGAYEYGGEFWTAGADWKVSDRIWYYSTNTIRGVNRASGHSLLNLGLRVTPQSLIIRGLEKTPTKVRLFNARGRMIMSKTVLPGTQSVIPTTNLPAGAHIVQVSAGNASLARKVLVR